MIICTVVMRARTERVPAHQCRAENHVERSTLSVILRLCNRYQPNKTHQNVFILLANPQQKHKLCFADMISRK